MRVLTNSFNLLTWLSVIALTCCVAPNISRGQEPNYLPGQIRVDPEHSDRLVYNRDRNGDGKLDPFFMCGPGGPEGFLYGDISGGDTPDSVLDKMIRHGGNCIYLQGIRSHGGDGTAEQNPFIKNDPANGIDHGVLDQWEEWFDRMQAHGIVVFFFFFDDSARIGWKDKIVPVERDYIRTVVNAFEHQPNLIWVIAEEYSESFSKEKVSRLAGLVRETDDHHHVIANHQLPGLVFDHADDPNLDQFAMQLRSEEGSASDVHAKCLRALDNAEGRYHVNLAKQYDWHSDLLEAGNRAGVRRVNWAAATTGMSIMHLGAWETTRDRRPPTVGMLKDYRHVYEFLESLPDLNEMIPQDDRVRSGNAWVLGRTGHYVVYLVNGGTVKMEVATAGKPLQAQWYNPRRGKSSTAGPVESDGVHRFKAPNGKDWVLHLQ